MTRRRWLLWGSLAASVVSALVDPSLLPFMDNASSSMPVAASVSHARVARAPATSSSAAAASALPASQVTAASQAKDTNNTNDAANAEADALAAERHELLRQLRAFVSGSGPSVGSSSIVAPVPRENMVDADGAAASQRLFVSQNWGPPPPAPSSAPVPLTPLPPTAPPVPFTYLGKAQAAGAWEVYLARGDKTFIVHENSVFDDVYRVESIKPPRLSLIYIPMNQQQELDIGGTQ